MQDYYDLISRCKSSEGEAAIKAVAMGAIILSRMGPIYQKGAVSIFQELAVQFSGRLKQIETMDDFDRFHGEFVEAVHSRITDKGGGPLSYGEAQKSINVFLKTYVDRSSLPDAETAKRLRPFLHVPLDSIMIGYFRKNFRSDYARYISPAHKKENEELNARNPASGIRIPDATLSKLTYIFKDVYAAWQDWFRDICPEKPILLDTIWALERERD